MDLRFGHVSRPRGPRRTPKRTLRIINKRKSELTSAPLPSVFLQASPTTTQAKHAVNSPACATSAASAPPSRCARGITHCRARDQATVACSRLLIPCPWPRLRRACYHFSIVLIPGRHRLHGLHKSKAGQRSHREWTRGWAVAPSDGPGVALFIAAACSSAGRPDSPRRCSVGGRWPGPPATWRCTSRWCFPSGWRWIGGCCPLRGRARSRCRSGGPAMATRSAALPRGPALGRLASVDTRDPASDRHLRSGQLTEPAGKGMAGIDSF